MASVVLKLINNPRPETPPGRLVGGGEVGRGAGGRAGEEMERGGGRQAGTSRNA
jgi:hypothetical protein